MPCCTLAAAPLHGPRQDGCRRGHAAVPAGGYRQSRPERHGLPARHHRRLRAAARSSCWRTGRRAATRPSSFRPGWLAPSLSPRRVEFWRPGAHALLQANPEAWERARRVIGAAGRAIASIPQVFEAEQPRRALREALLQAARDLVSGRKARNSRAPEREGAPSHRQAADAYCWGSTGTAHLHGRTLRRACGIRLRPGRGVPGHVRRQPAPLPQAASPEHGSRRASRA